MSSSSFRWTNQEPQSRQRSSNATEASQPPDPTLSTADSLGVLERLGGGYSAGQDAASTSLNLIDLELMVRWCNSTYQVLSRNERTNHIWRCLVPEEALVHPFLMRGILAASAIHLARIRGDHKRPMYNSLAVAHLNRALALFRELLGEINASNAKAMFSFASVVVLYTFGFPREPDSNNSWTSIDDLYQVLVLIRGIQQVINTASTSLFDGDFNPLLQLEEREPFLPDDARLALEELLEANNTCGAHDEAHGTEVYEDAVYKTIDAMSTIHQDLISISPAGRWAIRLKPEYLGLVRDHAPLALVILTYYCVILHYLRHHWCLDTWGSRVSRAVWSVLDDQWRPLVRWPMMQIFGQGSLDET